MSANKSDPRPERPGVVAARRAAEYCYGVERGREWAREGRKGHAAQSDLDNLRGFWRTGPPGSMFWFQRIPGWGYRDHLFLTMRPWNANNLSESAAFWAGLGLATESNSTTFLHGFVDGALGIVEPDRVSAEPEFESEA